MSKTMMFRNAMCIFVLFSIIALFFCFGVVASAEESSNDTPKLNTYPYSFSYNSVSYDWGYDSFSCTCISETPLCLYITQRKNGKAYAIVTGDLVTCPNLGGKSVRHYNDGSTGDGVSLWSGWIDIGSVSGLPIFDGTTAEGKAAAKNYLETGKLPEEKYNDKIDIPRLVFEKGGLTFTISNATNEYFVEMQGRNYSVDDVELYKEDAMWKYKYSTVLYNDLTDWITISDKVKSSGKFNLFELGKTSVANLNTKYPVDKRSYSGGKNALGNWLFGYDSALTQFKTLATTQGSAYLGTEIYIRFYYIDDNGDTQYGKWTHWYDNLASARGSTGSKLDDKNNIENGNHSDVGLTDGEKDNLEGGGNSRQDPDTKPITIEPGSGPETGLFKDFSVTNILTYFVSLIKTLLSATDTIAPFFNNIFGFLPIELRNVVYVTISAGCFCALIRFIFGKG